MTFNTSTEELIELALKEDIGDGDHTSLSTIPSNTSGKAQLLVKQKGILFGNEIAKMIFLKLDPLSNFNLILPDSSKIQPGDIAFTVEGKVHALLQAERVVLNLMQRLSGVASQTNEFVQKLEGLKTKVLDTRKTTPGMRYLEKMAVKAGGGVNHRYGLYDLILIKDNHIDFAGGIEKAILGAKEYIKKSHKDLKIEVEARSLQDIREVLEIGGIQRIMLDNFSVEQTKEAVNIINGRFETESSGGITLETIREYAECGVDFVSVGALTHQIKSLDLSLKAIDY